jgi:hypothetical protein
VLLEVMYDLPSRDDIGKCLIDRSVVLDRVNPTTAGVVRWVRSVQVDQPGLPGGLRARVQPAYAGTQTVTIEPAAPSGAIP